MLSDFVGSITCRGVEDVVSLRCALLRCVMLQPTIIVFGSGTLGFTLCLSSFRRVLLASCLAAFVVAWGGSPSASLAAVGRRVSQLSSGVFEARNIIEDHEVSQVSLPVTVNSYAVRYLCIRFKTSLLHFLREVVVLVSLM